MAIELMDLPIKNGDVPWLCKRLPEANIIEPSLSPSLHRHPGASASEGEQISNHTVGI